MPAGFEDQLGALREVRLSAGPLAYHERGEGPALVFVHGVFANSALWSKLVPLLADRYRCIAPDWPLGSHSDALDANADVSPPRVAQMIGALCQMFVVRHPGRVKRLVLTNCDAYDKFPPQPFTYLVWVPHIPGAVAVLAMSMRPRFARRLPIAYGWLAKRMPREVEDAFVGPVMTNKAVRRDITKFLKAANKKQLLAAAAKLPQLELPVLIAWGEDDKAFKISFGERLVADLPNARLVRIPDSYTFVPLDQPERLAEALAD